MNEKKLIELYKKQLAQSSEKAPEGLWDDIAGKMDTEDEGQLISQYKEELAKSSEKAPVGLWDDISRKMDLDEVWEGVATGLDEEKKAGGFWGFHRGIAAAIALLLISTLSVWFVGNLSSPDAEFAVTEPELTAPAHEGRSEETIEAPTPTRQPEFSIAITGGTDKEEAIQEIAETAIASLQEQDASFQEENKFLSDLQESTLAYGSSVLNPLISATASLMTAGRPSLQEMSSHSLQDEEINNEISLPATGAGSGLLALGFTTSMKNTWLFNHETFQGFNPGSGSRTHVQIYPDIAMSIRFALSKRWEAESSLSFSSNTGQTYDQYIFGRYSQREIALNYFQAEALANYKHPTRWVFRSHPISHSSSAGFYYGVLNSASEIIAGEKEDISTLYRGDDYGIITGHKLNIPLSGKLLFSPGIQIKWGLPNIYKGEYTLPSLKRTHNRSIELRFSLYYNFSR